VWPSEILISLKHLTCWIRRITAQRHVWVAVLMWVILGAYSGTHFDLLQASYIQRWGLASMPKFNA
jgi:hypothetical protein